MIKILVTGAQGQLGSSINFVSGNRTDLKFDYTDIKELDICNLSAVEQYLIKVHPHFIINCAAYTAVDKAQEEPDYAYQLNAEALRNLRIAAGSINAKVIHISTDYVFNGKNNKPYVESDVPDPESVYGQSKLKGELYLNNEPNVIIIRTSWLYSQFGNNFLKTIARHGREKESIKVVYDQTGTPTYAPDLAKAILSIIDHSEIQGNPFQPGIYHFSNEGVTSWYDFAWEIFKSLGIACRINPVETKDYPTAAPRPAYSVLNKTRIKNTFELKIPYWKESLETCIHYIN